MAKRKSVTGIKRKKQPQPQVEESAISPPSQEPNSIDPSSEHEDDIQPPISRPLLSLRKPLSSRKKQRVTKPKTLQARVKHVSANTIQSKWNTLDEAAQHSIERLVGGIQIPVLAKFSTEQSKTEAQELLQSIRASLFNRLPKTPFPPKAGAKDFDYEHLARSNREVQQQISEHTERVSHLQQVLENRKESLESDEADTEMLDSSIRRQEAALGESRYLSPPDEAATIADLPAKIGLIEGEVT